MHLVGARSESVAHSQRCSARKVDELRARQLVCGIMATKLHTVLLPEPVAPITLLRYQCLTLTANKTRTRFQHGSERPL